MIKRIVVIVNVIHKIKSKSPDVLCSICKIAGYEATQKGLVSFPHTDLNARGTAVYHLLVIFDILPSSSSKVSADQLLKITSAGSFSKCEVWPMTPDERRKTVSASWMLIVALLIKANRQILEAWVTVILLFTLCLRLNQRAAASDWLFWAG